MVQIKKNIRKNSFIQHDNRGNFGPEWGEIFLKISKNGLIERKKLNENNKDETIYLKHIEEIIEKKTSRAQLLLNKFELTGNLDFFDNEKEDFSYSGL